ncbi:Hypothetical protein CINCED_3A014392 [Cinara cedri]|uniref:Uncharacterized protein n=1 Tax=Cinara cedri TaxID=506608 RepID=A0A5E4N8Z2_9HEMI|nr:Hypothetical protein CINCED_3A022484 [Cinara cedri]VVC38882.1 Hypothetical protein CINCED_3A014392 [Cinara cedri]
MATKVICNVAAAAVGTAGLCFVAYSAYYIHYKRPNERKLNDQPSEEEGVAVEERNLKTIRLLSDRLKSITSKLISGFTRQGRITDGESGGTVVEYNWTNVQSLYERVKLLLPCSLSGFSIKREENNGEVEPITIEELDGTTEEDRDLESDRLLNRRMRQKVISIVSGIF